MCVLKMKFLPLAVQKLSSEQTHRQTDGQKDGQTDRHTDTQTHRHTDRHTDRQTQLKLLPTAYADGNYRYYSYFDLRSSSREPTINQGLVIYLCGEVGNVVILVSHHNDNFHGVISLSKCFITWYFFKPETSSISVECKSPACREYGLHKILRDVDILL